MNERHLARLILDEQKDLLLQNWYQDLWKVIYEERTPFALDKDTKVTSSSPLVTNARSILSKLILANLIQPAIKIKEPLLELLLKGKQTPVVPQMVDQP